MFAFLRLIRFPNLVIIALTQYAIRYGIIYPFQNQAGMNLFLPESLFGFLVGATVLIAASGYIINDYFDVKLDHVNKPKQLIIGKKISRRQAMFLHTFINAIGICMALYVAFEINRLSLVLFQLVSAGLLWFYSVNFKKQILIGNIIIAFLTALVPFTSGFYELVVMYDSYQFTATNTSASEDLLHTTLYSFKYLISWIIGYSAFAFLLTLIREITKDCEDIKGDKEFDCKTLPIVQGISKAKNLAIIIAATLLLLLVGLEYIQIVSKDWISLGYFVLFISCPLGWIIYRIYQAEKKKDFFIISQSIKILMLIGILYTGIIYLF